MKFPQRGDPITKYNLLGGTSKFVLSRPGEPGVVSTSGWLSSLPPLQNIKYLTFSPSYHTTLYRTLHSFRRIYHSVRNSVDTYQPLPSLGLFVVFMKFKFLSFSHPFQLRSHYRRSSVLTIIISWPDYPMIMIIAYHFIKIFSITILVL